MVKAIVGANWGDEGKGKITDLLANESDIVIRFQGGANAGHTIINEHGRFALHLMPSGVCHENIVNIIGNGVALDIRKFIKEYNEMKERGLNPKILVSDRAQIIMPYHVLFDQLEEEDSAVRLSDPQSPVSLLSIQISTLRSASRYASSSRRKLSGRRSRESLRSRMLLSFTFTIRKHSMQMLSTTSFANMPRSSSLSLLIHRHSFTMPSRQARRSSSRVSSVP